MKVVRFATLVVLLALVPAVPGSATGLGVGHRVENLTVPGVAAGSSRPVKVHLWYPADNRRLWRAPPTVYRSTLSRREPLPEGWLSWTVEAELARETDAIDRRGRPFPVIVFSHGSTNDPIDYAHTLELLAAAGYVVAAPYHVNNTQDDVRIDFVNGLTSPPLFPTCDDGLAWRPPPSAAPCARTSVPNSMKERSRDISAILDALPRWFGDRVDVSRAGVMGHSRGTVSALAAAGGSTLWDFGAEPRVKAVMGMAIGGAPVTFGADLANVTVPVLLVAGGKDANSVQLVSEQAFDAISSLDKFFAALPNATHRSFDSTYCAQLQSAGAAFDSDRDGVVEDAELANPGPVLDRHTVGLIAASAPGFLSGKAVNYCAREFFTRPVNIERLVGATFNSEYACDESSCGVVPSVAGPPSACVTTRIPCTGLETEEVKWGMAGMAAAFFGTALNKDRLPFGRYFALRLLLHHLPMVGTVKEQVG